MNLSKNPLWLSVGDHVWQTTLIGIVISVAILVIPRTNPRSRYLVTWLALLKFVLPTAMVSVLFAMLLSHGRKSEPVVYFQDEAFAYHLSVSLHPFSERASQATAEQPTRIAGFSSLAFLRAVWAGGVLISLALWLKRFGRIRTSILENTVSFPVHLTERLRLLASDFGFRGSLTGLLTETKMAPGVFGIFQPRIVIPRHLISILSDTELDSLLWHELAHVKRRENLCRTLQWLICVAFWFHPLVWVLNRRLISESERICDDMVLRRTNSPKEYAQAILTVSKSATAVNAPIFAGIGTSNLAQRIKWILGSEQRKGSHYCSSLLFAITVAIIGISLFVPKIQAGGDQSEQQEEMGTHSYLSGVGEPRLTAEDKAILNRIKEHLPNEPEQAATNLQAEATFDSSPPLQFVMGQLQFQMGNLESAKAHYLKAIEQYSRYLRAYRMLGLVCLRMEQLEEAERALTKAIELGDDDYRTFLSLARLKVRQKEWLMAKLLLKKSRDLRQAARENEDLPSNGTKKEVEKWQDLFFKSLNGQEKVIRYLAEDQVESDHAEPLIQRLLREFDGVEKMDIAPEKLSWEEPAFPKELQGSGLSGNAIMLVLVREDGTADGFALSSDHPAFTLAARRAILQNTFRPARKGGKPVPVLMEIPFQFDEG